MFRFQPETKKEESRVMEAEEIWGQGQVGAGEAGFLDTKPKQRDDRKAQR